MKTDYIPKVGDFLLPDEWHGGETLLEGDTFKDAGFAGCMFRVPCAGRYKIAVNVYPTGKDTYINGKVMRCRCRIVFVGDYEPDQVTKGWLYHD